MLEFTEELDSADVPELLDVTEELLLASDEELDLPLEDDFTELLEELSSLEESDSLEGRSPTVLRQGSAQESGKTDESSSPQATIKIAENTNAKSQECFINLS
ncbi:MAG: hypothetical protein IKX42_04280 [Fibrobacter sp.]|nr:hypothetical protein [Fibrobacter sp.]